MYIFWCFGMFPLHHIKLCFVLTSNFGLIRQFVFQYFNSVNNRCIWIDWIWLEYELVSACVCVSIEIRMLGFQVDHFILFFHSTLLCIVCCFSPEIRFRCCVIVSLYYSFFCLFSKLYCMTFVFVCCDSEYSTNMWWNSQLVDVCCSFSGCNGCWFETLSSGLLLMFEATFSGTVLAIAFDGSKISIEW